MSRKNLEVIVLTLGLMVIGAAVFFIFIRAQTPSSIYVTNLIISLGFLIYVIYSILATNNLNREIAQLNKQIEALKADIVKKNSDIQERDSKINQLEKDLEESQKALEASKEEVDGLGSKIKELEKEIQDLRASEPDPLT